MRERKDWRMRERKEGRMRERERERLWWHKDFFILIF